ncbi:hypothetical protein SDC9_147638 [bioreactor metagenome]|uniref:Uncharacterized protein n=1 Tax=bioreactor metagenome TaxID=1076179 RepID=A0A645EIN4_9ZZZZ
MAKVDGMVPSFDMTPVETRTEESTSMGNSEGSTTPTASFAQSIAAAAVTSGKTRIAVIIASTAILSHPPVT